MPKHANNDFSVSTKDTKMRERDIYVIFGCLFLSYTGCRPSEAAYMTCAPDTEHDGIVFQITPYTNNYMAYAPDDMVKTRHMYSWPINDKNFVKIVKKWLSFKADLPWGFGKIDKKEVIDRIEKIKCAMKYELEHNICKAVFKKKGVCTFRHIRCNYASNYIDALNLWKVGGSDG